MDNPFRHITMGQAMANELWNAITVEKKRDTVAITIHVTIELEVPDDIHRDEQPALASSLLADRAATDIQELQRYVELKLEDHLMPQG